MIKMADWLERVNSAIWIFSPALDETDLPFKKDFENRVFPLEKAIPNLKVRVIHLPPLWKDKLTIKAIFGDVGEWLKPPVC